MTDTVSDRLLDQRLRNRFMETLGALADGEDTIRQLGAGSYFNNFFLFFPDELPLRPLSTVTPEEHQALTAVLAIMSQAADNLPRSLTEARLIASGFPQRIEPLAEAALDLMTRRGRFSEEVEEDQPSASFGSPSGA